MMTHIHDIYVELCVQYLNLEEDENFVNKEMKKEQ